MPVLFYSKVQSPLSEKTIRGALEALLHYTRRKAAFLEISLVGCRRIRSLNRKFRGKDWPTDVLSFSMDSKSPARGRPWVLGEIVIAVPVAAAQARRDGRRLADQVLRLAVHGLVHLSGLDHEAGTRQESRFLGEEKKLLGYLNKKGWMRWDGSLPF